MTDIKQIDTDLDDPKDKYFYIDCRGTIVRVLIKHLNRIDLFRTTYSLTRGIKFQLDDHSPEEFNNYLNWLRDDKTEFPSSLENIYKYLNTDCEKKNEEREREREKEQEREREKEWEREREKELLNRIREEIDPPSHLRGDIISRTFSFKFSLDFYAKHRQKIDEYISNSYLGKDRKNFKLLFDKCEKHPYIAYWRSNCNENEALDLALKIRCPLH